MRLFEEQSRRSLPVCALTVLAQRHHVPRRVGDCSQYTVVFSRQWPPQILREIAGGGIGGVAGVVGIEGGVVSGVINLESSSVGASDWRPRHEEHYQEV